MVKSLHPLGTLASRIELPPENVVEVQHAANGQAPSGGDPNARSSLPAIDPQLATIEALRAPLNFPPLAQGTVPGDHLAIAIGEALPGAVSIVSGAIRAAEEAGIERDAISVVAGDADLAQMLRDSLNLGFGDGVKFLVHDADDRQKLCVVGLTHKKEQLLFNRTLYDADVVLPIGCARLHDAAGSCSVYDSLFPWFCDAETIGRMRTPSQRETKLRRAAARRLTDEAGWLLGVPMVIQAVPGGDNTVVEVVAGEPAAVAKRCQQLCEKLWAFRVPRRASLVIATVTGARPEQNWNNIGRALAAVEHLVREDGAVAICSDLELPPGPALGRLVDNSDWASVERDARNDHAPDSWPAWQLARALQRGPVYFYSQLESDVVEDMGLAPIEDIDEISRLVGHHDSCILLDDSQYAVASVAGEQ